MRAHEDKALRRQATTSTDSTWVTAMLRMLTVGLASNRMGFAAVEPRKEST
jgi:hypothetical protein